MKVLGVKKEAFKKIEQNKQLENRLNKIGYNLIERIKEGKKIYYILEQISEYKEIYNNMCNYIYKTKKDTEFKDYFIDRTCYIDSPISKKRIAERAGVGAKTITKWDNILIDQNMLSKDGYFYMLIEKDNNGVFNITQVGQQEYKTFWKNKANIGLYADLQLKVINGTLSLQEFTLAIDSIASLRTLTENKYYYRISKFKVNENNGLYIDTLNLIKNIYGNSDIKIEYETIT